DALTDVLSPFQEGGSHAVIEMNSPTSDPLADELHRYLLENKGPITAEQALKRLRRKGLVSYSFTVDKLPLYKNPRFIRFKGSDLWYLSSWKPANDQIFEYLVDNNMKQFPLNQLFIMMETDMGLPRKEHVFVLEGDSRFKVIDDNFVIVSYDSVDTAKLVNTFMDKQEKEEKIIEEVAMTMSMETQTSTQTRTQDVFESVLEDINSATEKLEQRIQEMEEEVLTYFKDNNMSAITQLVNEKEKSETITRKLEEVMELLYGK
ncbi:MAG TPA: hypothetical protein DDY49_12485, partial [Paenibacillaceae bacterium]|nr:hypothetical protein [Paenibacillaceae bacterium]